MANPGTCQVLLLQSPITLKAEDVATFGFFPPIGLAYLAAALEDAGIGVAIHDLLTEGASHHVAKPEDRVRIGLPKERIEALLHDLSPAVVGISSNFTSFHADCMELAALVRRTLPEALIVIGGAEASVSTASVLGAGDIDAVVIGEGEHTLRDLARCVLDGRMDEAQSLDGTAWRLPDGAVRENPGRPPIEDLDALPMPAWHLVDMGLYMHQKHANFAVVMRRPVAHMITTRGCPYNCIFCSTTKHYKRFRVRSAEKVLDEMAELIARYGIREFHFHDDSFAADPDRVRSLCEGIVARGMDIKWQVSQGITSSRLDADLLALMKRSGMYRVGFPIESGSRDTLRFIRKPIRLDKVRTLIATCNELGLYCFGCFMIGFPEETPEEVEQTRRFILDSGLDYIKVSITQPLRGSDLYGEYERLGLLDATSGGSTYGHTLYPTRHFTAPELNAIRRRILGDFGRRRLRNMLTPGGFRRFVWPKLRGLEAVLYFIKVAWIAAFADTTAR